MLLFPPIKLTRAQLYMRACIRACVYASMRTFLHVFMCVFVSVYKCVFVSVYMCVFVCVYIYRPPSLSTWQSATVSSPTGTRHITARAQSKR